MNKENKIINRGFLLWRGADGDARTHPGRYHSPLRSSLSHLSADILTLLAQFYLICRTEMMK